MKTGQAASVEDQACAWLARLEADDTSVEERAEFAAWLRRRPEHAAVFRELSRFWDGLDGLAALREFEPAPSADDRGRDRRRTRRIGTVAAAAIIAVTALLVALLPFDSTGRYATAIGERQVVSLVDGSTIELNTDTRVSVDFDEHRRHVTVHRGEAHFTVEPDPQRTFRVTTPAGEVLAVGTAFAVRIGADRFVEVTVTEGIVEIAPELSVDGRDDPTRDTGRSGDAPKRQTRVTRGQVARFDRHAALISAASEEAVSRTLAWRRGAIVFDGQTLDEAVREMNRYTPVELVVVGPALSQMRIGGYFRTGDIESFIAVLEASFDIEAHTSADNRIELKPR